MHVWNPCLKPTGAAATEHPRGCSSVCRQACGAADSDLPRCCHCCCICLWRRYEAFAAKFPFLCTTSVKANSYKKCAGRSRRQAFCHAFRGSAWQADHVDCQVQAAVFCVLFEELPQLSSVEVNPRLQRSCQSQEHAMHGACDHNVQPLHIVLPSTLHASDDGKTVAGFCVGFNPQTAPLHPDLAHCGSRHVTWDFHIVRHLTRITSAGQQT